MKTKLRRLGLLPVAVAGLAAGAALFGIWRLAARTPPPANVVVITLDTTRADRLSPYGFMNVSLPHLERLAEEGVVFDQATSVAPLTLPAHATLFTGLLPPRHGVRDNASGALDGSHTTLAERLRDAGFRTGAFVGAVVLDPDRGLQQGFETYRGVTASGTVRGDHRRQRRGQAVIDDAVAWLETMRDERFFLWAHLYDPHRPYDAPEPFSTTYAHNPYVGEIAYADAQIGRLIGVLEQRRWLDRTLVIVVADHGESLGAHGERDHGIFIYEDVLRVPLIVRAPGLQPGRVGEVVRVTDVMPTVLDVLDVPAPPSDGVSLADLMHGRRSGLELEAYAESLYPERFGWSALRSIRHGWLKLIQAPRPELYDLSNDPFETRNIYADRGASVQALSARLAMVEAESGQGTAASRTDAPSAVHARLAALGYVSAGPGRAVATTASRVDPKDCIGLMAAGPIMAAAQGPCGAMPPVVPDRPPR